MQALRLSLSSLGNLVSHRMLRLRIERVVFLGAGDTSPFRGLVNLLSVHLPLARENLQPTLMASGSIPPAMSGVHVVPGYFDNALLWRRAGPTNFRRALLLSPSPEHVARLPFGKIPDPDDFYDRSDAERMRAWLQVWSEGERLEDELREWMATVMLADHLQLLH